MLPCLLPASPFIISTDLPALLLPANPCRSPVSHLSLTCLSPHCREHPFEPLSENSVKKKSRRFNICGTFSYLLNNTLGVHSNNSMYRIIPGLPDFLSLTGIPLLSENSFLFHRFRCCLGICIFWDVTFFIICISSN